MITLSIKPYQRIKAIERYQFWNLPGSFTEGKSQTFGAMGEVLVEEYFKYLGYDVSHEDQSDYDLIIQGKKIEVKTKRTTVKPEKDFLCSVANFNASQDADYYFFVRIDESYRIGYMLGYYPVEKFKEDSFFKKAGEKDINGWTFKKDCYNLKIEQLIPFKATKVESSRNNVA